MSSIRIWIKKKSIWDEMWIVETVGTDQKKTMFEFNWTRFHHAVIKIQVTKPFRQWKLIDFGKTQSSEEIEKVHSEIKLSFDRNCLCVVKTKLAWFVAKMILQNGPTGFRNSWNWRRGRTEKTREPMLKFASCMRKLIKKISLENWPLKPRDPWIFL